MSAWPRPAPKRGSDRGKAPQDTRLERWATKRAATFAVGHNLLRSRGLTLAPGTSFEGRAKAGIRCSVVDRETGEDRGQRTLRQVGLKWVVEKTGVGG